MSNPASGVIEFEIQRANRVIDEATGYIESHQQMIADCEESIQKAAARRDALQSILDGL